MDQPQFRRTPRGDLQLAYSQEAKEIFISRRPVIMSEDPAVVEKAAKKRVLELGGNVNNMKHVLSQTAVQFGKFQGRTFLWLVENALSYAGWIVSRSKYEGENTSNIGVNKTRLRQYLELFPEGREIIETKRQEDLAAVKSHQSREATPVPRHPPPQTATRSPPTQPQSTSPQGQRIPLSSLLKGRALSPEVLRAKVRRLVSPKKVWPPYKPQVVSPVKEEEMRDSELLSEVEKLEASSFVQTGHTATATTQAVEQATPATVKRPPGPVSTPVAVEQAAPATVKRPPGPVGTPVTIEQAAPATVKRPPGPGSTLVAVEQAAPVTEKRPPRPVGTPIAVEQAAPATVKRPPRPVGTHIAVEQAAPATVKRPPGPDSTLEAVEQAAPVTEKRPPTPVGTPIAVEQAAPATVEVYETTPAKSPQVTSASAIMSPPTQACPLYEGWRQTLLTSDHQWVSRALFHVNQAGKAEIDLTRINRLWYHPPPPPKAATQTPRPDRYFATRLLMWMPRRLWQVRLFCPHPDCHEIELVSAGTYQRVRQVLDIDGFYNMAAEYLQCKTCGRKVISWSSSVVQQLDVGHRLQFPVILTHRLACDLKVVTMLRQRGLGNSSTQLQKKLQEQHGQEWYRRLALYLTDCQGFASGAVVARPTFRDIPSQSVLPSARWLLTVYCQDVLLRLPEVKASITSVFGTVLKMDSTKKVVKKLAGHSTGTATWATNVGNEHGQVLASVLTASEGHGLESLATGLVTRYQKANIDPPKLLYVDRDCCGKSIMRRLFAAWPEMEIRLDIWHFMRRFSAGCTTDAHPLYATFMSRLSQCLFRWSSQDLQLLRDAKRAQLSQQHVQEISDRTIAARITKKELALHCRRQTRGVEETTELIVQLLQAFDGDQGRDTTGVPLLDSKRIWDIWESQRRHVACIQDPDHFQLYTKTGTLRKGGIALPVYRCARGSTSLESFHLHLNTFIPGSSASDVHFQAYLLEGLHRWNEDRAAALQDHGYPEPHTYSSLLRHAMNRLSTSVLHRQISSTFVEPRAYTGELLGVEYLFNQTGQALQPISLEEEDVSEAKASDEDTDEDIDKDEGFQEAEDLTIGSLLDDAESHAASIPGPEPSVQGRDSPVQVPEASVQGPQRPLLALPVDPEYEAIAAEHFAESSPPRLSSIRRRLSFPDTESSATATKPDTGTTTEAEPQPLEQPAPPQESMETSEVTSTDEPSDDIVGPDDIGGYGKVEALANYLATLRNQTKALSKAQSSIIIALWNGLSDYDKKPTTFSPRFRSSTTGRFKASKTPVAPGVESTRRCFLGQNTGPAQWPDANRYVEATIIRLCEAYPTPTKSHGVTQTRWTQILRAYKRIRDRVLCSPQVMAETKIQLIEVNNATLMQWYNRRSKQQDVAVLQQGLTLPAASATAEQPLPEALSRPSAVVEKPPVSEQHHFELPPNTAGMSPLRKRRSPSPVPVAALPAAPRPSQPQLPTQDPEDRPPLPPQLVPEDEAQKPRSWYWKRKYAAMSEGKVFRNYSRRSLTRCRKCGHERDPVNHKQFYGNWYCAATSDMPYEEWRAAQKAKGYSNKKRAI